MRRCLLWGLSKLGKSKKRIIYKGKNLQFTNLTREEAAITTAEFLNSNNREAYSLITLFGLTAEEILEAGASYEVVKGVENLLG